MGHDYHALVEKYGGVRPAARAIEMPESTFRHRLKAAPVSTDLPPHAYVPDPEELGATHVEEGGVYTRSFVGGTRRFICTSAQNNCEVHAGFLANLKALAEEVDAEILIGYTVYDRQNYRGLLREGGKGDARSRDVWWDQAVKPYAANVRCELHRRLAFCGELDVIATAKRPLSGLDSYCSRSSIIVPHNRFEFRCVESRKGQMPKEMATTGSVTKPRFIQRKTGQVAHFHHITGALLVEVEEDGHWHIHHLNAEDDGSFYWLDRRVENGEVTTQESVDAVVVGDIHHEKLDDDQSNIVLNLVERFSPKYTLIHDLIDFTSRNHHTRDNPLFRVRVKDVRVEDELRGTAAWLSKLYSCTTSEVVVVKSNHDTALNQWIRETDWRQDPPNAEFYLQLAYLMVLHANFGLSFDPLEWAVNSYRTCSDSPARFLKLDESFEVNGIECGIHGHAGPSGARGNPAQFARLGFKTFTAHTHSPSIIDGCYTVGVSGSLNMGYNTGPSRWMHAHGIIYKNGKRAFLFVKNGKWRIE